LKTLYGASITLKDIADIVLYCHSVDITYVARSIIRAKLILEYTIDNE